MARETTTKRSAIRIARLKKVGASTHYRAEPSREVLSKQMRAFSKKLSSNPVAAQEFLLKAGIVTSKGNLRKTYGG